MIETLGKSNLTSYAGRAIIGAAYIGETLHLGLRGHIILAISQTRLPPLVVCSFGPFQGVNKVPFP
jgi:hypothetical protein